MPAYNYQGVCTLIQLFIGVRSLLTMMNNLDFDSKERLFPSTHGKVSDRAKVGYQVLLLVGQLFSENSLFVNNSNSHVRQTVIRWRIILVILPRICVDQYEWIACLWAVGIQCKNWSLRTLNSYLTPIVVQKVHAGNLRTIFLRDSKVTAKILKFQILNNNFKRILRTVGMKYHVWLIDFLNADACSPTKFWNTLKTLISSQTYEYLKFKRNYWKL